jgi:hypothetical protein
MSNPETDPRPNQLEVSISPSRYETIDEALLNYVDKTLNTNVLTNKGWIKVPVVWKGAERAFQVKHDKEIKDSFGSLKLPIITVRRTKEEKNAKSRGAIYGQIPVFPDEKGGSYITTHRILQDKTGNFANTDALKRTKTAQINFRTRKKNNKIVVQTITIPQPVYIMCHYEVKLMAEFEQQLNDMKTPFITTPGAINYIRVFNQHHRYEGFIDGEFNIEGNSDASELEPRYFETNINIRILGYLIGEDANQEKPKMVIRENAVEIKFPRERVILGDIPEHLNDNSFYREF